MMLSEVIDAFIEYHYPWRSAKGIAIELGVSIEEVEKTFGELIEQELIEQHPDDPELWCYIGESIEV